jgi:hypothetical protein
MVISVGGLREQMAYAGSESLVVVKAEDGLKKLLNGRTLRVMAAANSVASGSPFGICVFFEKPNSPPPEEVGVLRQLTALARSDSKLILLVKDPELDLLLDQKQLAIKGFWEEALQTGQSVRKFYICLDIQKPG